MKRAGFGKKEIEDDELAENLIGRSVGVLAKRIGKQTKFLEKNGFLTGSFDELNEALGIKASKPRLDDKVSGYPGLIKALPAKVKDLMNNDIRSFSNESVQNLLLLVDFSLRMSQGVELNKEEISLRDEMFFRAMDLFLRESPTYKIVTKNDRMSSSERVLDDLHYVSRFWLIDLASVSAQSDFEQFLGKLEEILSSKDIEKDWIGKFKSGDLEPEYMGILKLLSPIESLRWLTFKEAQKIDLKDRYYKMRASGSEIEFRKKERKHGAPAKMGLIVEAKEKGSIMAALREINKRY